MSKGYWVANVDISDLDEYKKYVAANAEPFRKYGGKFLTRGGKSEIVEDKLRRSRVVVLEFPSFESALACYRSPRICRREKAARTGVSRRYRRAGRL